MQSAFRQDVCLITLSRRVGDIHFRERVHDSGEHECGPGERKKKTGFTSHVHFSYLNPTFGVTRPKLKLSHRGNYRVVRFLQSGKKRKRGTAAATRARCFSAAIMRRECTLELRVKDFFFSANPTETIAMFEFG